MAKLIPSGYVVKNYENLCISYKDLVRRYGENNSQTKNVRYRLDAYESKYDMTRPVDPAKQAAADGNKHYIEIRKGGIKVKLDMNEIHVTVDSKFAYTKENIDALKEDISNALEVIASAAKIDDKLKPKTSVEI
jgi:hypothetical protein